jgi:hypothetical protein
MGIGTLIRLVTKAKLGWQIFFPSTRAYRYDPITTRDTLLIFRVCLIKGRVFALPPPIEYTHTFPHNADLVILKLYESDIFKLQSKHPC